jgi:hypothetical protein
MEFTDRLMVLSAAVAGRRASACTGTTSRTPTSPHHKTYEQKLLTMIKNLEKKGTDPEQTAMHYE